MKFARRKADQLDELLSRHTDWTGTHEARDDLHRCVLEYRPSLATRRTPSRAACSKVMGTARPLPSRRWVFCLHGEVGDVFRVDYPGLAIARARADEFARSKCDHDSGCFA